MSDYLAIGGVSQVLCYLLTNAIASGPSTILGSTTPAITAKSPDLIQTGANEQAQLNVFMYYVSVNPALRNFGLPAFNGQGGQVSNPPLPLDLHYLITAYGAAQFDAEILLAWAMKVLFSNPVVPSQTIENALNALRQSGATQQALLIANNTTLAQQVEQIRITPEVLTTEEIYRLWPAFQAPYRPSTVIQVSVVVIQDTEPVTSNLPPKTWTVTALPLQGPVITGVTSAWSPAGQQLTITGSNFIGTNTSDTVVTFDSGAGVSTLTPSPQNVGGGTIQVTLPATMVAGARLLQVQQMITWPGSATPHPLSSNSAAFQLIPAIQVPATSVTPGSQLALTVSPPVEGTQQVIVYIGDRAIPIDQPSTGAPATTTTITCTVPADLSTGTYPVRIEVDGAQSTLTGTPLAPNVTVAQAAGA